MNKRLQHLFQAHRLMEEATGGEGGSSGGSTPPAGAKPEGGEGGEGKDGQQGSGEGEKKPSVTDTEAKLLKEVMQNKDALKKANEALAQANERLKNFDGIDPEQVKKLVADQKAAEEKQLEARGEWDRLKARMAEEHGKEVTGLKGQLSTLQEQLAKANKQIGEMSVGQRFATSHFIANELTLTPSKARLIYGDHFDVQEDGSVVGYDKPRGAANRTPIVDASGNPVDFDGALRKLVDADSEKDYLLRSKAKPGAGSDSKKAPVPSEPKQLDRTAKIAAGLKTIGATK